LHSAPTVPKPKNGEGGRLVRKKAKGDAESVNDVANEKKSASIWKKKKKRDCGKSKPGMVKLVKKEEWSRGRVSKRNTKGEGTKKKCDSRESTSGVNSMVWSRGAP